MRLATPHGLENGSGSFEKGPSCCWNKLCIEEDEVVVGGVPLATDKPRSRWNGCSGGREFRSYARIVCHLRERTGIGAPLPTATGAAIVRGLLRIV